MAGVETIIVGGGIQAGSPFSLNFIPFITAVTPPQVQSSPIMKQVIGANPAIIIAASGTDPQPAATELLRVKGGIIAEGTTSDSTVIGRGATAVGTGIAIGKGAVMTASALVIGTDATAAGNGLVIGQAASLGAATNNSVVVGNSASTTGAGPNIIIGTGNSSTNCINTVNLLGTMTSCTSSMVIMAVATSRVAVAAIFGTPTQSNQFIVGSPTINISNVLVGAGDTRTTPFTVTYRGTNGSGVDNAAGSIIWQAPLNTGNITSGGDLIFQTGAVGVSGSALQAATTRMQIHGGTGVIDVTTPGFNFVGFTNGAAAAVGTLNNAPAAGNPTFWLPVQVAGVAGHIPIW